MRVLITGSSGQIGTNLGLRLLSEGHEVVGIDRRDNTWTDKIPMHRVNLSEPSWERLVEILGETPCDAVVHLAAYAKVFELVKHPERSLENVTMLFNALEAARQTGLPFIFGSSREVYGDIHRHITEESCADFVIAESPYSASKISGEAFIYSYAQCYGLKYLVFRFSNVYGRFDNDIERMERVIPLFIDRLSKGQSITIFGSEKMLDFTYVDDCVDGIYRGLDRLVRKEVENETINLAYGQGNSLGEMARLIAETLEVEADIDYAPTQPGEVTRYVADISKAQRLLGYQPTTTLQEGIPKAIAWARSFQKESTSTLKG
jgi:UDP-glucose 4-epimerase